MYSSDSDYGDSDDECLASLKRKTRGTLAMPYSKATPPPMVCSYETLLEFRQSVGDSIILSVDFETMDHPDAGKEHYHKMSELGLAVFDPRDSKASTTKQPTSPTSSNALLETFAKTIHPQHVIANEWKHITEDTCDASYHNLQHKFPDKAHHAQPYRCRFAHSQFLSQAQTMERLKTIIRGLSTQHQTEEEKRTAKLRSVKLIVWASYCEEQVFLGGGIDLASLCPNNLEFWDFQLWVPFKVRFPQSSQAKGETAFQSLGALGSGVPLHNGCNDAVAQLISFIRFLVMTPVEWRTWFDERGDLEAISLDWVKPAIYNDNYSQRPLPPPKKKNWSSKKQHNTAATSRNRKPAPGPVYAAKSAPRDVTNATSNNSVEQGTWKAESSNSRGNGSNSTWAEDSNKAFPDHSNKAWSHNANNGWSDKTNNGWSDKTNNGWPKDIASNDWANYSGSGWPKDIASNDWANYSGSGWPKDIASNDWANYSGSGWPNSSTPSSSNSSKTSASSSGWPAGMGGWNDSPAKSTGWPDGMSDVDDSEDTPANSSGWPPGMDGWIDSSDRSTGIMTGWPDGMSDMDGAEDPSVNVSGWPAGMDDPEDTTSAVASGNNKNEKAREDVPSSSDRVLDNDEWFTVYHSRRAGKKGPFKPNAFRR